MSNVDKFSKGEIFPITHWLWVIDWPFRGLSEKHGIGGTCAEGIIEYAKIDGEIADQEVAQEICGRITSGCDGKKIDNALTRAFVCTVIDSHNMARTTPGRTNAGSGYSFIISYGAIQAYRDDFERAARVNKKLRNIQLK
jgi:hypothetical protein